MARSTLFRRGKRRPRAPLSEGWTRKEFLQSAGAAFAGALLPACVHRTARALSATRVAIVGGGLAGLECARLLAQQGVAVTLFEATPRWGGRVWTQPLPRGATQFCELGAELIDAEHVHMFSVARELGLKIQELKEDPARARSVFSWKGQLYSNRELDGALGPLLRRLKQDQKQRNAWDAVSLSAYLDSVSDLEPWVRRLVEVSMVEEWGLDPEEQSALNLFHMPLTDSSETEDLFGEGHENYRIEGGNGRLPAALLRRVESLVEIRSGYVLKALIPQGSRLEVHCDRAEGSWHQTFDHVVLATPATAYAQIEGWNVLELRPRTRQALKRVSLGQNGKWIGAFRSRFWRNSQLTLAEGRRGSDGTLFVGDPALSFWEGSRGQAGEAGLMTCLFGGREGRPGSLNDRILIQALDKVFPGISAQQGAETRFQRWGQEKFFLGSYVCPRPGEYAASVGAFTEWEHGGRLSFIGEHTALRHPGYMEGALESAKRAVQTFRGA